MGVDFSMSLGYGMAIKDEDVPGFLESFDSLYEDGGIVEWLEEMNFNLIGYDYCGDWMNGNNACFFYARGTEILRQDLAYMDEVVYDFTTGIDEESYKQLKTLADILEINRDTIGWKLIANVS